MKGFTEEKRSLLSSASIVGVSAVLKLLGWSSGGGKRGWHLQRRLCPHTTFGRFHLSLNILCGSTTYMTLLAIGSSVEDRDWLPPHRLLYASNAMVYPIRGALRYTYGGQWEVRQLYMSCQQ